jgi:XTP/dITP diphosphohydrolase
VIPRLVVASKNPDKRNEILDVLEGSGLMGEVVQDLDWPDIAETADTLEGNALLKARSVAATTGLPVIADDTGLEVDALAGDPGVRTARFAGPDASYEDNVTKLLEVLDGVEDRSARFRTVVALAFPDGVEVTAAGSIDGRITTERRGEGGFGYDPVFEVGGVTLAEMSLEQKNALSHRARALRSLLESLRL